MLALRLVYVLALAVWLGGMTMLGAVVAPTIFQTLQAADPGSGRALAGLAFAAILTRFHLVAYGCGAVLLLALFTRAVLGPRPRHFALRFAIATVMVAAALYSGLVVSQQIAGVQRAIGPGVAASSLPDGDPRRAAFGRLHALSTLVQLVPLVGGMVLLGMEATD